MIVMPVQTGHPGFGYVDYQPNERWIPAFAGMTDEKYS
jgi:hypothetical protein